jgi:hypothetical protein
MPLEESDAERITYPPEISGKGGLGGQFAINFREYRDLTWSFQTSWPCALRRNSLAPKAGYRTLTLPVQLRRYIFEEEKEQRYDAQYLQGIK